MIVRRSRLHLAKLRFYIGRHLFTKSRGSRFTFYVFFLHHFTCRRRWATGSWSSSAGGSGRSLAPWKSWWWWWWWLQIVVMVTIMMKRLELCHRAAHLAHAGRHVRQGAVHVSGHWPAAGGKQKSRFGRILVRGGASMVFFVRSFFWWGGSFSHLGSVVDMCLRPWVYVVLGLRSLLSVVDYSCEPIINH